MATNNQTNGVRVEASDAIFNRAVAIADKLNRNETLSKHVNDFTNAAEVTKRGPVPVLLDIRKTLTAEELASLPVPGTSATMEIDGKKVHCNNPDKYERLDTKTGKSSTGSFYSDLARRFEAGKVAAEILDFLRKSRDGVQDDAIPEEIVNLRPDQRSGMIVKYENKLNNIVRLFKQAVRLEQQLAAFAEFKHIRAGFIMENNGTDDEPMWDVIEASACVKVAELQPNGSEGNYHVYTASGFIGLSIDYIRENGGTYKAVLKANKRRDTDKNETEVPRFTLDTAEKASAEYAAFLENDESYAALLKRLNKKNDAGADAFLVSLGDIRIALNTLWETNKEFQRRYERAVSSGDDADDKANAA